MCHQLATHHPELDKMMNQKEGINDKLNAALTHYRNNTAQIEVRCDIEF